MHIMLHAARICFGKLKLGQGGWFSMMWACLCAVCESKAMVDELSLLQVH